MRELTRDDAAFVLELLNDRDFIRFIGDRGVRTLEHSRDYIEQGPSRSYADLGIGLLRMSLQSGAPVGLCGLLQRNFLPDPDLGFALLPAFRGTGLCHEAARAVIDDPRAAQFDRISAIVQPDNGASIALLGKLGFVFERRFRVAANEPELLVYAMLRDRASGN